MKGGLCPTLMASNTLQLRSLLEDLPVGAYLCNPAGFITYFNRRAADVWGRKPKLNDVKDRYCGSFRLFWADGTPMAHNLCWMAQALKHNQEYNGREVVIERPDGQRVTALAYANPIRDGTKKMTGAVNFLVAVGSDSKKRNSGASQPALRILIVDDQAEEAASFTNLMQKLGHAVCIALDGRAALHMAGQFHPDIILITIDPPKRNGHEVATRPPPRCSPRTAASSSA